MRRVAARSCIVSAVSALLALVFVAAASADKERIHLTRTGQEAARAAVVAQTDLGTLGAWTGGARKPDLASEPSCPGFHPRQSDLILNGAAETRWKGAGIQIDSEAEVLQTPRMVRLDWQRTVLSPGLLPCLRAGFPKQLGSSARLVSLERVPFPKIARYTTAIRALFDVKSSTGTVRLVSDFVLFGAGRTELTLVTTAPFVARAAVHQAEVRLVTVLVSRIRL